MIHSDMQLCSGVSFKYSLQCIHSNETTNIFLAKCIQNPIYKTTTQKVCLSANVWQNTYTLQLHLKTIWSSAAAFTWLFQVLLYLVAGKAYFLHIVETGAYIKLRYTAMSTKSIISIVLP